MRFQPPVFGSILLCSGALFCFGQTVFAFAGPDLAICRIGGTNTTSGFMNLGASGGIRAFSADSVICNFGDAPCNWDDDLPEPDNAHPVISQTMYRLHNGRFMQIGQSWVKHGGNATNQPECGLTCTPGKPNNSILRVGCCDAYSALINGTQNVGPKSEINPSTGFFPFPYCSPAEGGMTCPSPAPTIGRRLQVKDAEIDLAPGNQYFMQLHVIVPDDIIAATLRTDGNNASYRRVNMGADRNIASWAAPTVSFTPAIRAWRLNGLGPGVVDPAVIETTIDVPGDGRFDLAAKVTTISPGLWRYEYAVQNYNSDRAAGSFLVPLPAGAAPANFTFHDVDWHSGEPYSNADWTVTTTPTSLAWATTPYSVNVNANALRWDTLFNFGFNSSLPPHLGAVTLGLFKPGPIGAPVAMQAILPLPAPDCNGNHIADSVDIANGVSVDANGDGVPDECQDSCPADIDNSGVVDVDDLLAVITGWGACAVPADCPPDIAPSVPNGVVDVDDLLAVITAWGNCPAP